ARRHRGPLALRPSGDGRFGDDRGPAHDRLARPAGEPVVNPALPDAASELAAAARRAFEKLGGVDTARRAEADPSLRTTEVAPTLAALGLDELDPRADEDSLAAAAVLSQEAGRVALPYPVPAAALATDGGRPFAVVPDDRVR